MSVKEAKWQRNSATKKIHMARVGVSKNAKDEVLWTSQGMDEHGNQIKTKDVIKLHFADDCVFGAHDLVVKGRLQKAPKKDCPADKEYEYTAHFVEWDTDAQRSSPIIEVKP